MLILDVIVIALIALGAFSGYKKGLVGVIVGFASLILSIILAFAFQSVLSDALYNSGLGPTVNEMVQSNMQAMLDNNVSIDNTFYGKILPSNFEAEQLVQSSEFITRFIMKGLSFVAIFLVVHLICYILQMVLNIVFNLPGLNSINSAGGIAVGTISVLIKIWVVLAVLSFVAPMFTFVMDYIDKTMIVKLLYNNNFLVAIIKAGLKI